MKVYAISFYRTSNAEHHALCEVLQDVFAHGRAQTFIKAVADWCVRNGMMVTQTISGIHYIIRLE